MEFSKQLLTSNNNNRHIYFLRYIVSSRLIHRVNSE